MMAWVMEMAHTHCLLQLLLRPTVAPNEPWSSCHTAVPSIPVVTIPATALYEDLPWSSQGSREGMWESMGSWWQRVPVDGGEDDGEQPVFPPAHPGHGRGREAHYL